ncbi:SRPBCC domain-containing protein [Streptomyces sp. NBC_01210]|uniref:SRPBCC family protein n=1 Tax=Streptomyces sp. NBC_01210 TaxID=2903774 RepID=UPI002E12AED2|nr:SRPBCC domain-containing protein [Streptomyces sp. NBC_01210]
MEDLGDRQRVVTLALRDLGGQATELVITQEHFATVERYALKEEGWTQSVDKLERLMSADASA